MSAHSRKWQRGCVEYARSLGIADADIEPRSKHLQLVGTYAGKQLKVTIGRSPNTSHRARAYFETDIRRAVRAIAGSGGQ